jgi:AICAR transformylase/IMP cyclohydrolase PurH
MNTETNTLHEHAKVILRMLAHSVTHNTPSGFAVQRRELYAAADAIVRAAYPSAEQGEVWSYFTKLIAEGTTANLKAKAALKHTLGI